MRHLISAMLVIVAVIHLLPLTGALGPARLTALYGIPFDDPNLSILMRHRAVLFGLLGIFPLVAAFRPDFQLAAFIAGFISVASFMYFAWSAATYNTHIARVFTADVVAFVCLVIGVVAYGYSAIAREG